jgi:SAM-dependent methyltransferase
VDLSPTMIAQAQRRAAAAGLADRCQFRVQDLSRLEVDGQFDVVLGVTVLQHILDPQLLRAAVRGMTARLAPGGRMILLEAAPAAPVDRCDSTVFQARHRDVYLGLFQECALELRAMSGVDPAPLRMRLLPHLRKLPRTVSMSLLVLTTALSLPVDALFGRRAVKQSWHAVFVLEQQIGGRNHGH